MQFSAQTMRHKQLLVKTEKIYVKKSLEIAVTTSEKSQVLKNNFLRG